MNICDIVDEVRSRNTPPQGMTSLVELLQTERGKFALKLSERAPFVDWLKREAFVLQALETTHLPVPRYIALDEQADSASLLMSALPGEPLSELLRRGISAQVRLDLLSQFGETLASIHSAPQPQLLRASRPWLQRILDEGRFNLEHGLC